MKLTFKTKDKLHVVSADEILICEVVGNYSRLVLNDKDHYTYTSKKVDVASTKRYLFSMSQFIHYQFKQSK